MKKILVIIVALLIVFSSIFAFILYDSSNNAINRYQCETIDLYSNKLDDSFDEITILFFTDIMYGSYYQKDDLAKFQDYLKDFHYDIVIYGGNIFDKYYSAVSDDINILVDFFNQLDPQLGKFAIFSSYDLINDSRKVLASKVYSDSNFIMIQDNKVLNNSNVPIYFTNVVSSHPQFTIAIASDYQSGKQFSLTADYVLTGSAFNKQYQLFNDDEYHFGFNGNIYVSQSIGLTDKDYRLLNYPTITLITLHKESD